MSGRCWAVAPSWVSRAREAIAALFAATTRRFPEHGNRTRTRHLVLNPIVEIEGATAAVPDRRSASCSRPTPWRWRPSWSAAMRDAFARDGQGWHFTERKVDVEMIGDVSDHLLIDPHSFG